MNSDRFRRYDTLNRFNFFMSPSDEGEIGAWEYIEPVRERADAAEGGGEFVFVIGEG